MPTDHDNFVLQLRISPRDLGDGVEAVFVIAGELYIDIHLNGDWDVGFKQPIDAPVVFDCRDYNWNRLNVLALIAEPSQAAAAVNKDRSARAAAIPAVAARENHCQRMLLGQKLRNLLPQLKSFHELRSEMSRLWNEWIFHNLGQVLIVHTLKERLVHRLDFAHFAQQNHFASNLSFVFIEVLFLLDVHPYRWPAYSPIARGRPGCGLGDEHCGIRRSHARPGIELLPAHP